MLCGKIKRKSVGLNFTFMVLFLGKVALIPRQYSNNLLDSENRLFGLVKLKNYKFTFSSNQNLNTTYWLQSSFF